jgi:hypothetical protein
MRIRGKLSTPPLLRIAAIAHPTASSFPLMAVGDPSAVPGSPNKKRKVKTSTCKPWAICEKPHVKDWRKEDYLIEFAMNENEWELFDAQVWPVLTQSLIAVEI